MNTYKDFLNSGGEKKWQDYWEKEKLNQAEDFGKKPKQYVLDMFPYPSAAGLHVGHPEGYTATDIYSRYLRLKGFNVLHPMGWDAFGLPAENYAIKTGTHPAATTAQNIATFKRQIQSLGFSYDWRREVDTTDPDYYQWTQWIFLKLFERGLAYEATVPINFCPSCKTGLANEEVKDGRCERCGAAVEKKDMRQWLLRITAFAERLLAGLEKLDWPESIKALQRNWIGKSEGAEVTFTVKTSAVIPSVGEAEAEGSLKEEGDSSASPALSEAERGRNDSFKITVYTTRPDTLFGATYMVLAPEHELVRNLKSEIKNWEEVEAYINKAKNKSDLERTELAKEKTGVELKGISAVNPVNSEEIPIWISDYVLASYGTGAIMAVPAHDERDFEFAKKFNLPMITVITPNKENVIGMGAMIQTKNGKFLFQRRDHKTDRNPGMLAFFGGGIEGKEDIEQTLKREIKEELNLEIDNFVLLNKLESHNKPGSFLDIFYVRDIKEEDIKLGEGAGIEKFDLSEALKREDVTLFTKDVIKCLLENKCFTEIDQGQMVNSDFLNGLAPAEAISKMTAWLTEKGCGRKAVNYKLRDWVFSRQRYWGEPIPLVYCENCARHRPKILVAHGLYGHSKENWFPWFKSQMEKRGYGVLIPDLPNNERPTLDEWIGALSGLGLKAGEDIYIIGHSLGAPTVCQFILKTKLKVNKLILVGPTGPSQGQENWDNLLRAGCDEESLNSIREFNKLNVNLEKLKGLAEERVIYLSDNDPYIPLSVEADYEKLEAKVLIHKDRGHFNEGAGIRELPEILEEFPGGNGWVAVPEKDLPLTLPEVEKYEPSGTGESPLATIDEWVNTKCPKCGGPARRETNTMPQWAGSSWYWLRFIDPQNKKTFADFEKLKYWLPVDLYLGGAEHAVLHLLYARFWNMVLYDIGAVPVEEPFQKLVNQGMILGESGEKMSKSRGNVINPDEVVAEYGADAFRMYEMFMGPLEDVKPWSTKGIVGISRFLEKVWGLFSSPFQGEVSRSDRGVTEGVGKPPLAPPWKGGEKLDILLNKTIKKVGEDIASMRFNTAISAMMVFTNKLVETRFIASQDEETAGKLLIILSPFAPHLAEELWRRIGHKESIFKEKWPAYDENLIKDEIVQIAVQINGKVRGQISVAAEATEAEVKAAAMSQDNVKKYLEGQEIKKVIFVKGKLISFVV